jgi:hypothetical protein
VAKKKRKKWTSHLVTLRAKINKLGQNLNRGCLLFGIDVEMAAIHVRSLAQNEPVEEGRQSQDAVVSVNNRQVD